MSAETPPWVQQNESYGAEIMRRATSSFLNPAGGVATPGSCQVTQTTVPSMAVTVAGGGPGQTPNGELWIPGTESLTQGAYYGLNDADLDLAFTASDATHPRITLVYAAVEDTAYGDGEDLLVFTTADGTPASSPVAPSLPSNAYQLASVYVGAGVSSIVNANITDTRSQISLVPGAATAGNPMGRLIANADTTITTSYVQIAHLSAGYLLNGGMAISSNGLVVPVAGTYAINGQIGYGTLHSAQTFVNVAIYLNGATYSHIGLPAANATSPRIGFSDLVQCAAGDVLTLWGRIEVSSATAQGILSASLDSTT